MARKNFKLEPSTHTLKKGDLFAVYGSLLNGLHNHRNLRLNERATFVRTDLVKGTLYSLGAYPGLIEDYGDEPDCSVVSVEVYRLDDSSLAGDLDRLEGYTPSAGMSNDFYIRSSVPTIMGETGETVEVYFYQGDVSDKKLVSSGCWRDYVINS